MNKETLKYFNSLFNNDEKTYLLNLSELDLFNKDLNVKDIQNGFFKNSRIILDDWIKFYNSNNLDDIVFNLKLKLENFKKNEDVYYYCSDKLIIKTDINTFFKKLFLFLEFDDDSPIVFIENIGVLLFTPLGKVLFIPPLSRGNE